MPGGRRRRTRGRVRPASRLRRAPIKAEYDALGRVVKTSNPYRPHLSETPVWTTTEYDALGRVFRVQTPDDGEVSGLYEGTATTVTDQAGKQRRSIVNALGQLVRVDEPNGQNRLGIVSNPAQATAYKYNANGELVMVTQGQQVSRISLGSSQNAGDLWSVNYDYGEFDAGGNLQADKNNGDVARQTINFAGLGQPYVQSYKYDSLRCLTEATELSGATQTWKQTFSYDRYGNRTSINQQKLGAPPVTQTPAVGAEHLGHPVRASLTRSFHEFCPRKLGAA